MVEGEGEGGGEEESEDTTKKDVGAPSSDVEALASPTTLHARSASWGSVTITPPGDRMQKKVTDMEKEVGGALSHMMSCDNDNHPFLPKLSVLHRELSRNVEMCSNYESQLQRVQEQMVADMEEKERTIDRLRAEAEKFKVSFYQASWVTEPIILPAPSLPLHPPVFLRLILCGRSSSVRS